MEIDEFREIAGIIALAKELHDIDRNDIVKNQFSDALCYDSWYENVYGAISSVFSDFYSDYSEGYEAEMMIFMDDVISDYFTYAWELGKKSAFPHDKNPLVIEAIEEIDRQLSFCYSINWKLLAYTKTKRTAKQSKLIVYIGMCECDCHTNLALSLIQLYKWFSDKIEELKKPMEVMAA